MKREIADFVAAILEAQDRAASERCEAGSERYGPGSLDTAARAILRNRRRCRPLPGVGAIDGAARP